MNPPPESAETPLFARPWPLRFAFALLAGLTLVAGLTFFDNARRAKLEAVSETTAVGDGQLFKAPAKLPVVAATLGGKPLYVMKAERIEIRDTHTERVGERTPEGPFVYRLSPAATREERDRAEDGPKAYLLKVKPNEYVRAHLAAP